MRGVFHSGKAGKYSLGSYSKTKSGFLSLEETLTELWETGKGKKPIYREKNFGLGVPFAHGDMAFSLQLQLIFQ